MMTVYRVARKPVGKSPLTGPDQCREDIPGYLTSDQSDRLSHPEIYRKMATAPVRRVTRIRTALTDSELDFEYEEGDFQLAQVEKKFNKLSRQTQLSLRKHFQKK